MQIIPNSKSWKNIQLIDRGWSREYKYKVTNFFDINFLLRIADIDKYSQKKTEFETLNKLSSKKLNINIPFEIGVTLDEKYVYTIANWVEGIDTLFVINDYSKTQQYEFGIEAGRILQVIHSLPIDTQSESWSDFYNQKINKKIEQMQKCPIKLEHQDIFIECINQNRHLLLKRHMCFQHGDFHIGNTLINTDGILGLIDFNRHDIGDPWEEFNRIPFSVDISPEFASGCIDGYFDHKIPTDFFPLLALYISVNQIASLPWAMNYGAKEIETMQRVSKLTLACYDNFKTYIPSWYIQNASTQ